jgi:hypothetical protein
MKPFFIVLLSLLFSCSYSQQFSYQKEWSTYYFGSKVNGYLGASALDNEGNNVVVGTISSNTYNVNISFEPSSYYDQWATPGAYQQSFMSGEVNSHDGYVTKFTPEGTVQWSTYFGGMKIDYVTDVAIDSNNNIYIVGMTNSSSGIATNGAYISDYSTLASVNANFISQGFLAKFSPAGVLQWATYTPMSGGADGGNDNISLAIAADDMVFVYSKTLEANASLIPSIGAFQQTFFTYPLLNTQSTNKNAYILKFDGQGNKIAGTFCGSSVFPSKITTDSEGNVIIVGFQQNDTSESLASTNCYQPIKNSLSDGSTSGQGFISKFSADLSTRIWSTYYGGAHRNIIISIGTLGTDLYIYGMTASESGIFATAGTFSQIPSLGYMAKFNGSGTRVWGSYCPFGENLTAAPLTNKISAKNDKIYLTGRLYAPTGVSTAGAYQSNVGSADNYDGFMMQFTTDGLRNWGSYFGGARFDTVNGITVVDDSTFYLYGVTESDTTISTAGSLQPNIDYGSTLVTSTTQGNVPTNMFLAKFSNPLSVPSVSNNLVKLAPNPTDGQFTLSGNWHTGYNNLKLQLYDSLGKEVAHEDIAPFQEELHQGFDFRGLAQGLYFAKLTAGAEVLQTIKLLIK